MDKSAASIAKVAAEAALVGGSETQAVHLDLPSDVLEGLRAWIADQPEPRPSVQQAIRLGLAQWLSGTGYLPRA